MPKDNIPAADLGGDLLTPAELAAIPDFAGIRKETWEKFPGAIARKQYRAGEILLREGENGSTAFYILSGTIELYIRNPLSHVESRRGSNGGWLAGLTKITRDVKGTPDRKADAPVPSHIPIDASVDLPMDNPIAEVGPAALAALKHASGLGEDTLNEYAAAVGRISPRRHFSIGAARGLSCA